MPNAVIVGTQWGDEGKAKVIDYLARFCDIVVRFHGGANAGHTVIANREKFVFHLVPSGIMYPGKLCVVGNGVVLDIEQFLKEVDELRGKNITVDGRLFVSDLAHLVMPYHKLQDSANESAMGAGKIGTTGRGIGPAYADKASRTGLRVGDLVEWAAFSDKLRNNFEIKKQLLSFYKQPMSPSLDEMLKRYKGLRDRMLPFIADTSGLLNIAAKNGKNLLFEGAQGTFLDIDHGTYPFVTSSNTIAGAACTGAGVGPSLIHHVVGIVKAYTTRVGNGPFPTELDNALGERIRAEGGEFGATTGRPRRCGWFDSVLLRRSAQLNGLTRLAITKLDVLNSLDEIQICTHYEIDGKKVDVFPTTIEAAQKARPCYETMPGWKTDLSKCKKLSDLPKNALKYVKRLQELCYDLPLLLVSIGPDRTQTIEVEPL
ncbi:MAG TPA: adenylosuccinate synthase [Chitinivibrionales bacterium]|nr:adenylosuccinate synthase [Chitinivibrionales bacterium]